MFNFLFSAIKIGALLGVLGGIIYLLPTGAFPPAAHDSIVSIWGYLKPWTFFLNIGQFFIVLTIIVFTEGVIWAFIILMWFYRLIFGVKSS
ncbi:hypothetical protein H7X87_04040 [Acetobacteraceae bacterium]|nr:hypothetical protein [Candidatus Parcubacteria bacterium]